MGKKILLSLLVIVSTWLQIQAQVAPPCGTPPPPGAGSCTAACVYCDFDGYMGLNNGAPSGGNTVCGQIAIHNDQWFGFVAGSTTISIDILTSNCQNGNGLQAAFFANCVDDAIVCNPGGAGSGGQPLNLTYGGFVPGQTYFLMIDGWVADICNYEIDVIDGSVTAPPPSVPTQPQGPTVVCPGATVTYTIPDVEGAGYYNWTSPPGSSINGGGPAANIAAPDGTTITVTFGNSGGAVCVRAGNACNPISAPACINVVNQPIPPTVLPKVIVCNEDLPYELPWGPQVSTTGTYSITYDSYQGCDSIVRLPVQVIPPKFTNLPSLTVCSGGSTTVCGQVYTDPGNYSVVCTSFQGCDSLINFAINVLDPIADIFGGGTLSCVTTSITLNSATSNGTKLWRNLSNNTIAGNGNTLVVTAPGTYSLTTTINSGGVSCSKADTIVIAGNTTPPIVNAIGGTIGCISTTVTLSATTNATNPAYQWAGPNGFSSTLANPIVSVTGTYALTITNPNDGCSNTSTAIVNANNTPPSAAATGNTITCANPSVPILATSNVGNATFSWTGPNGFTSNLANPSVSVSGNYSVVVTNPTNSCTALATASVTSNTTVPGATASSAGTISCPTPSVTLNGNSPTNGVTYSWAGPNAYTATGQNPSAGTAGVYTVSVTSTTNGCVSTATTTLSGNTTPPSITAAGDTITCGTPTITLTSSSTASGTSYAWSGPNSFSANVQNPQATTPGTYQVTVTASNGCTNSASAVVLGDFAAPNASATGGVITCSASSVTISGSSSTPNVAFLWSGPGNFSSNLPVVSVNTVGTYTLTAIATNGCTATATAAVTPDAGIPNASATGGTINCLTNTVTITGNSTTPNVTVGWVGPNGFVSAAPNPTVSTPGSYILVVTNNANACTAQATAVVNLDTITPGAGILGDTLTCTVPTITLNGNSTATNVTYAWTGPAGFTPTAVQNPTTTVGGPFNLVVTAQNGCTSTASITIPVDQTAPVATATTGTLTCKLTALDLGVTATLPVTYNWAGPLGFNAQIANPTVSIPGNYTVTVTAANGCTDLETVTLAQDIAAPGATTTGDTISCAKPQVQITVTTPAVGALISWGGPSAFNSTVANPLVTENGFYSVTVTGTNGCTSIADAIVEVDTATAQLQASAAEVLTCATTSVVINANVFTLSPVSGLVWTGPNSFNSTVEDPSVPQPGLYTLVATTANGCTASTTAMVDVDIASPDASATAGILTCAITSISIDGVSTTPGATFDWTGPNGFTSTNEDPSVTAGGVYNLVVTGPNGCTQNTSITVNTDVVPPGAAVTSSNNLDCDDLVSNLEATATATSVQYAWAGPNGFTSAVNNPTASEPGAYQVTITGANGCTSSNSITITQDVVAPDIAAVGDTLDCFSGTGTVVGTSNTPNLSFSWTGPNGFTAVVQSPAVSEDGTYNLLVTAANGCTNTATTIVAKNQDAPQATVAGGGTLTCNLVSVDVTSAIQTPGATGVWSGPNGFTANTPDITADFAGVYTYTVTGTNGCVSNFPLTVFENIILPAEVVATGGQINCNNPVLTLQGNSITSGVSYEWSGPNGYTSTSQNPNDITAAGSYTLVVTDPVNGCTESAVATVTANQLTPTVSVATDTITCIKPKVVFISTVTPANVTYAWTGPNGFTATTKNPTNISVPGAYTVVVKAVSSGCTATATVNVIENTTPPGVTAEGDTITCAANQGVVTSTSATNNVTYAWTGPGSFTSALQNPTVTLVGIYTVTVTGKNGCISVDSVVVAPDKNAPQVTVTGGTKTCTNPSVNLVANSNIAVTWLWTGPNGFTSTLPNPATTDPGNYLVVATAANGCSVSSAVNVIDDSQGPATAVPVVQKLTCTTTQITLNVEVQGSGTYSYNWEGGNIVSGNNSQTIIVSQAATYSVTVTNNSNGCTSTNEATVDVDDDTPSAASIASKDIVCYGQSNGSIAVGGVTGGLPPYLYSLDNAPFTASSTFTSLPPGPHNIVIQDANGCEYQALITLTEPDSLLVNLGPDTIIHLGETIDLSIGDVTNDPARIEYLQVNPASLFPGGIDSAITLTPLYTLRYTVTAVDTNGCKATDTRLVIVNKERLVYIPNVFNPDSDNNNLFMIFGVEPYEVENIKTFLVFDRWGSTVHEYRNFLPNNPASGWDGRIKGDKAAPAIFTYFAEILFKDGLTEIFKGDVLLER